VRHEVIGNYSECVIFTLKAIIRRFLMTHHVPERSQMKHHLYALYVGPDIRPQTLLQMRLRRLPFFAEWLIGIALGTFSVVEGVSIVRV
jgi:hypothetical protein